MSNAAQLINNLDHTINTFKSNVDVKVNNVHVSTNNIQATTDKIYENINRFKTEMLHGEEKQIAHENILRIDQIIKEQFSSHVAVRRTVMGVVKDFDINLVRNSTIQELSEELWITSSRYWLSYALIAITAWVNDYQQVAQNALAESGRKDPIKTTLLFCLMNFRFNRIDTAKQWFFEYFKTLDPTKLQQETSILLQAFLNGIFGKDKEMEHEVIKLIEEWIVLLNENEEISNELTKSYESYIRNLNPQVKFDFPAVTQFCTHCTALEASYKESSKFDLLVNFVKEFEVETQSFDETNYKSRIDAILMNLISNYDSEELELKNQQEYYKFIVENNGVVAAADSQYAEMEKLQNENFNIGKQMMKWAIYDDNNQTDVSVRKYGFKNTRNWFKAAISSWSLKTNEAFPIIYQIKIDGWETQSNGNDLTQQNENMKQYYENNKFTNMFVNNINIAAAIVLIVSLGLVFLTIYSLIFTLASAGFLGYRVMKARKEYPARINTGLDNLSMCIDQITEIKRHFEENKAKRDLLYSMVDYLL
jgi:hypothetical protein